MSLLSQEELDNLLRTLSEGEVDDYDEIFNDTETAEKTTKTEETKWSKKHAKAQSATETSTILDRILHSFFDNIEKELEIEKISIAITIETPDREEPVTLTMTF